jgi:hypothetical protein
MQKMVEGACAILHEKNPARLRLLRLLYPGDDLEYHHSWMATSRVMSPSQTRDPGK